MTSRINYGSTVLALLLIAGWVSPSVQAAEDDQAAMKSDKTGTNPINFRNDVRLYNEFSWLNTAGDGDQNVSTLEIRTPFADDKWQFRVRARAMDIGADTNNDGVDELNDSGFGDLDFRFLTVPYLDMAKKMAFVVGFETFLDTASENVLGTGTTSFGPQAFLVFFTPFGIKGSLFAPAYQHKFSVDEAAGRSEISQGLIDLFFLKQSKDKLRWALIDPQIILDYETNTEYMLLDIELGTMLDPYLNTKGHSAYIRPALGVGQYRPVDYAIEVGYKVIW